MSLKIMKCIFILIRLVDLVCLSAVLYLTWLYAHLLFHLSLFGIIIIKIHHESPKVHRPARTVSGFYGELAIPDSRNWADCNAFKVRQIRLCLKAQGEKNSDLVQYHVANTIFVFINPLDAFRAYIQGIPCADFQRVQFHFRTLYSQFYGFEEID